MTNGSAPSADAPENESSTAPTDGPLSEPGSIAGELLMKTESIVQAVRTSFENGWNLARTLPQFETPPELTFLVSVDEESQELQIKIITP